MDKAIFFKKDNNWQKEETVYWFHVSGKFSGEYGVCDHNGELSILDSNSCPIQQNSYTSNYLLNLLAISDDMITK